MHNYKSVFITLITLFHTVLTTSAQGIKLYDNENDMEYDSIPYMVNDHAFNNAYIELTKMFNGEIPLSLKRAEFLVENAYYGGNCNYQEFCHDIDSVVNVLNRFIDINNFRKYKTAPNFAVFEYFTHPSIMNGNREFTYDFENAVGLKDYTVCFTSNLLKTHKGQCVSMPLLYKILCDELGGKCYLAYAPMHIYIKHLDEEGNWINLELTHGGFVRDEWIIESMHLTSESIRNGIFLCALNEQETTALMLMQLARAYQNKYNSYDYFIEQATETILQKLPNFCDALLIKYNLLQKQGKISRLSMVT